MLGGGRLPLSLRSAGRHRPTALARSVAYHTMRGANNPPKKGRGPHAPAPLCSAPLAWSLPWCSAACPMLCINSDCVCPTPSRKPRPFSGGLTARIMCGCGRARRARPRGLRGLRVSAARRRGRRDASRRGLRAVGSASRIDVTMRRVCGHARRPALPPRSGGCAALGLPAHGHTHTAYLLSCWVPWATGATMGARCGAQ